MLASFPSLNHRDRPIVDDYADDGDENGGDDEDGDEVGDDVVDDGGGDGGDYTGAGDDKLHKAKPKSQPWRRRCSRWQW